MVILPFAPETQPTDTADLTEISLRTRGQRFV